MTTSVDDAESYVDQTMNFTALLILIQLDEIVIGAFFTSLGKAEAFENMKEEEVNQDEEIVNLGNKIIEQTSSYNYKIISKVIFEIISHLVRIVIDLILLDMFFSLFKNNVPNFQSKKMKVISK